MNIPIVKLLKVLLIIPKNRINQTDSSDCVKKILRKGCQAEGK